jgi:hypothetical protein
MANDLKKDSAPREELMRKFTRVEQAGNRILVSAAGAAGLGGAFAGGEGAAVGAIVGAFAGVIAGLLLSAVHIASSVQAGRSPGFETAAQLVLSGVGVGTGLKVLKNVSPKEKDA